MCVRVLEICVCLCETGFRSGDFYNYDMHSFANNERCRYCRVILVIANMVLLNIMEDAEVGLDVTS